MKIWEMGLGGSVLIAVILVLRVLLRRRLPRWTFAALWWLTLLRLLLPVELPSPTSVYSGLERLGALEVQTSPGPVPAGLPEGWPEAVWDPVEGEASHKPLPVSPLEAVYLAGALAAGGWFLLAWRRCRRLLRRAVPVEGTVLAGWRCAHPGVAVKTCPGVDAPMAFGLVHPVILFPENTDWDQSVPLSCALAHEYAHIRRGDLWCKAFLSAALCLHWYNPLVWLMARAAVRDLELACDEAAVRRLGLERRRDYALALLGWEETRSGFSVLCQFTQPQLEERIGAIMKLKKTSWAAILAAALLVAGVTAVFATSAAQPKSPAEPSVTTPVQGNPLSDPAPADPEPPEQTVQQFFEAFQTGDYESMKAFCTQHCQDAYFHDGGVFGMVWAKAVSLTEADPSQVDGDARAFLVDVEMEAAETSVFPGETETSFYILLTEPEPGVWKIDSFVTGL